MTSPLLSLPDAVAGNGVDAPVAAHYGSFNREQRLLAAGDGFVDLSHRGVVRISGPDRLEWLHSLTTQHLADLAPGVPTSALVLSPQGHLEHVFHAVDDGEAFTAHVEPGRAAALVDFLEQMKFMTRVEIADVTDDLAVAWRPVRGGRYDLVPRGDLRAYADAAGPPAGTWAFEALRIARGEPRFGLDTDDRTIPNELGWVPAEGGVSAGSTTAGASSTGETSARYPVHLDKGCYRGQETVARVHNLGRPPRRLTLLHLDGSANRLPTQGTTLERDGRTIGFVGSSARHHELGPIALALIKRAVPVDATLDVDGLAASQEVVVDPEVGLHVRPRLR